MHGQIGNKKLQQDCSYQGEALNFPTAFRVNGAVFASKEKQNDIFCK